MKIYLVLIRRIIFYFCVLFVLFRFSNIIAFAAEHTYYLHTDQLGSVLAVTDENGNNVQQSAYASYGEKLATSSNERLAERGYTGQIKDNSTSLMYYNARYYDPALGRFISADTVSGGNRFAYAAGNPLLFNDPSGNIFEAGGGGGSPKKDKNQPVNPFDDTEQIRLEKRVIRREQAEEKRQRAQIINDLAEAFDNGWVNACPTCNHVPGMWKGAAERSYDLLMKMRNIDFTSSGLNPLNYTIEGTTDYLNNAYVNYYVSTQSGNFNPYASWFDIYGNMAINNSLLININPAVLLAFGANEYASDFLKKNPFDPVNAHSGAAAQQELATLNTFFPKFQQLNQQFDVDAVPMRSLIYTLRNFYGSYQNRGGGEFSATQANGQIAQWIFEDWCGCSYTGNYTGLMNALSGRVNNIYFELQKVGDKYPQLGLNENVIKK